MEFLLKIRVTWPADVGEAERNRVHRLEAEHGAELAKAGFLRRLWRVPGTRDTWSLWDVTDATQLHELLSSLPLWPRLETLECHAVARHPNDPQP